MGGSATRRTEQLGRRLAYAEVEDDFTGAAHPEERLLMTNNNYQVAKVPIVWAAIIVAALVGLGLYALVSFAVRAVMPRPVNGARRLAWRPTRQVRPPQAV